MDINRPRGREKNVTGQGKDVYKRGDGLGIGPVGSGSARPQSGGSSGGKRSGGKPSLLLVILALLLGGGGGAGLLFGGNGSNNYVQPTQPAQQYTQQAQQVDLSALLGNLNAGSTSSGWQSASLGSNLGKLNTSVAPGSRAKYTNILGNGKDTVTVMVYMCGTDLESRSGMATSDLQEMVNATIGNNVNLIVYTGGCSKWQNNIVSNKTNQIYQVKSGGLVKLVDNAGSSAMTKADNLSGFIQWCAKNYPANRNELIFWDHGGGSLSGYGYDEKYASSGSMTLAGINTALKDGGVKFDFIGFDACLMATVENALMLTPYADYMIASEETEPGVGWYYTNWLTALSKNTSMPTIEIGKKIVDDFVDVCAQKCRGQATTLSVVDLAELENTVPQKLSDFSSSTSKLIENKQYQAVSSARSGAREFSSSSKIDQVDLTHLACNLGTKEGKALADALTGAVKYNRTSSNMSNAYGLSVYFPYRKASKVSTAVATYEAIGMDDDYMRCIQQFASMEVSGQAVSNQSFYGSYGGSSSPLSSLSGSFTGGTSSTASSDMIAQLLGTMLSGNFGGVSGMTGANSAFFGRSLPDNAVDYLAENQFDAGQLVWTKDADGTVGMTLSESQWALVQDLQLNVFFDDGEGYIDLGLDNVYDFTEYGALKGEYDGTWLAINDQPVAYYHLDTMDDGTNYVITGRVPVMLNGVRADLILIFDNDNPYGYIAGARYDYRSGETETIAKNLTDLNIGDKLEFLCDYYGYDGSYQDSYYLGDPMTVTGDMVISNVYIDASAASAVYRFVDLYQQEYWTPVIP